MNFFRIRLFKVSSKIKKSAIWRSYHKVFLKNCSKEFNYYPYKKHYWIIFPSFSSLLMMSLNPVSSWESTHFECGLALCHKSHVSLTNEAKSFLFVTFTLRHDIYIFFSNLNFPRHIFLVRNSKIICKLADYAWGDMEWCNLLNRYSNNFS